MQSGQFFRGKIDGIQKHYESPNIDQMLPNEKLVDLKDNFVTGEYPRFFKAERVMAKTVVSEAENTDGRRGGTVNHTVLYQFDASITHEGEQYIFDVEAFIAEILAGKRRLKMPSPPTLPEGESVMIDLPPPIEWEV